MDHARFRPRCLHRNERGGVAVSFALGTVALLLASGMAIDYGNVQRARAEMQAKLDASVLAAVATSGSNSRSVVREYLKQAAPEASLANISDSQDKVERKVRAEVSLTVRTPFMGLAGLGTSKITVASEAVAPMIVTAMRITVDSAFGWSDKVIRLKKADSAGMEQTLLTASYRVTNYQGANARGTGTTTITPSQTVSLGDYSDFWFEMDVYEYNSSVVTRYSTRNANQAEHLWVNGVQLPSNAAPKYGQLIACSGTATHAWEDSRNRSEWAAQDITFRIEPTCSIGGSSQVRLIK